MKNEKKKAATRKQQVFNWADHQKNKTKQNNLCDE